MNIRYTYNLILVTYVILWLCQTIIGQMTHSLLILTDSYINLYNILDITLSIIHLKTQTRLRKLDQISGDNKKETKSQNAEANNQTHAMSSIRNTDCENGKANGNATSKSSPPSDNIDLDYQLFGYKCSFQFARLPLLGSFVNGLFLAALLMSAAIEGIQTCFHEGHLKDSNPLTMLERNPFIFPCFLVGFAISGALMQWCTRSAHYMREEELQSESLLNLQEDHGLFDDKRQRLRCLTSPVALLSCAVIIHFIDNEMVTEISDAGLALCIIIVSYITLFPLISQSGVVLLQTAPMEFDIDAIERELRLSSPYIVKVKDFHIWRLTARSKLVATCRLVLKKDTPLEKEIHSILSNATSVLKAKGVRCITIEPVTETDPPSICQLSTQDLMTKTHALCQ